MQASTEEECEAATELFEQMLEEINQESFSNFEEFADLANYLAEDIWSEQGMFAEVSSQLFTEYEIGAIDWIWKDPAFLATLPKFLEGDIHFGCFVLTEVRSSEEFTALFADVAIQEDCDICAEMGDGWISPAAYVAEDASVSIEIIERYYTHFKKNFDSGDENEKYAAIAVLRALAGNPRTPEKILNDLAQIHECSLGHEIRSANGGDDDEVAIQDSFIDWKAKQTLKGA
ncbi:hypothetical protein MCEMRE217_00487 [Candidatus Nanopelagicaceae bacterium]